MRIPFTWANCSGGISIIINPYSAALVMLGGSLLVHDATSFEFALVAHGVVSLQSSADDVGYGADAVFKGTVIRPDASAGAGEARA